MTIPTVPLFELKTLIKFALSNLNIFRKNDIRGFITAKGELKGKITDPDISINFNVDYPHFKGIRIRETWEGDINNENNELARLIFPYLPKLQAIRPSRYDWSEEIDPLPLMIPSILSN